MSLQTIKLELPIAGGLNQRFDQRAIPMPSLLRATNVQFDEMGGVQTRKPYEALGLGLLGGGTVTDVRRLAVNGDELLLWTRTQLYAWSETHEKWVPRGEHLAVKVEEEPKLATKGDQFDGDRAELAGITAYTWAEGDGGVYVACVDSETGTVTYGPYRVTTAYPGRPRLVALDTRILLFFYESFGSDGLYVYSFDPLAPGTAFGGPSTTVINSVNQGEYYDVVARPNQDEAVVVMRRDPTTSYSLFRVDATPTVTASTKARDCDGPIAVALTPDGLFLQIIRTDGSDIVGDFLDAATFADTYLNQAIGTATGTPINQVTLAYFADQVSGAYRAQVYWSAEEDAVPAGFGSAPFELRSNWVDSNNTIGAPATDGLIAYMLGVASQPFAHDGHVYIWVAFGGESSFTGANAPGFRAQLQNTYFLYRDDGAFVAKAVSMRAGGYAPTIGRLPAVTRRSDGVFTTLLGQRRIVSTSSSGKQKRYDARACCDITVMFDSNEARRSSRLGQTLYVTGGEVLQYDGQGLTEVGFHVYPWFFLGLATPGGSIEDGDYAYKMSWRWLNARGEMERSTTATVGTITVNSADRLVLLGGGAPLIPTHKTGRTFLGERSGVAAEWWRTEKNPTDDSPFYLVSSQDPGDLTNPQRFTESRIDVFPIDNVEDGLIDADLTVLPTHPENGSVLESLCPPAATIIHASADRLFLAGVAGDPSRVWYSKLRGDGEVAAFHDALTATIPTTAGAITAIAIMNETLFVFSRTAVYALPGDGIDNAGGNQTFGPARLLSSDVGALSQESVALIPDGVIFKSAKGWYRIDRGWSVQYIGAKVCDYDAETVVAVHVLEAQHQVRVVTANRVLVLDTVIGEWAEWTVTGAIDAGIWQGRHIYLDPELGVMVQQDTHGTDVTYGLDVELLVKLDGVQGFGRVRRIIALGEWRSAHKVRMRVARDYQVDYFDDVLWTATPEVVGGPLEMLHGPSQQQCKALRVRITAYSTTSTPADGYTSPTGEALKLTSLALECGLKNPTNRRVPAAWRK